MVAGLHELTALENEPGIFVATFWRDFYRSMLTHTARNALTKLFICILGVLLFMPGRAFSADHLNLIVLEDLSKSESPKAADGHTEFQKNLEAVTRLLSSMPAGSHVTVVGITDNSFAQPYILLSAEIGDDEGYFKERLANARQQLVRAWRKRCAHLEPTFKQTDIVGALLLASQLFQESPNTNRKLLVIFSDMRQNTHDLDLETPQTIGVEGALSNAQRKNLLANLTGVKIRVLGADNAGKSMAYWQGLRDFWGRYFARAGASIENYSVLRLGVDLGLP